MKRKNMYKNKGNFIKKDLTERYIDKQDLIDFHKKFDEKLKELLTETERK